MPAFSADIDWQSTSPLICGVIHRLDYCSFFSYNLSSQTSSTNNETMTFWWRCYYWDAVQTRSVATGFGQYGMPLPVYDDTGTALGQDGSDWSRDLATLTFDLGGHGAYGWCGSSSFIHVPSLKLVGLAVRKIWCTLCVSINGPGRPGDLDRGPFNRETGMRVTSVVGSLHSEFGHVRPSGSRVIRYLPDGWTDRQTKATLTAPFPTGGAQ